MSLTKIKIPFVIWTLQRTGGTNFNKHLNRLSCHDKLQDEPFNSPREHGQLSKDWLKSKDRAALKGGMTAVCSSHNNIKHCVERVPWAVSGALVEASHEAGYAPVFLYRENPLQRLLSMEYAQRTQSWGPKTVAEAGDNSEVFRAPLDVDALIEHETNSNNKLSKAWRQLRKIGAAPVAISYEELYSADSETAQAGLQRVFSRLGIKATGVQLEEAIRSTGDQQTRDRYAQFTGIKKLQERIDSLLPPIFARQGDDAHKSLIKPGRQMKRLILHAGMHKTGTTGIQSVLAKNRDDLYAKGVYYPKSWEFFGNRPDLPSANAHFSLFDAFAKGKTDQLKQLDRFKQHLKEDISQDMTVLISAESMVRHGLGDNKTSFGERRARFVARIAEYFEDFHTEVVLYFRQPDAFAESMCSGAVAAGSHLNFEQASAKYLARFRYRHLQDAFARHFPVSCQSFEAQKSDLVRGFFNNLALPMPADPKEITRRPSIPKPAVLWLLKTKKDMTENMGRSEVRRRWIFGLQRENADIFRSGERSSFWPDEQTRDHFRTLMLADFDAVNFAAPGSVAPLCVWSAADHDAAERRFRDWERTHAVWLADRAKSSIAPFTDPQAPSESLV